MKEHLRNARSGFHFSVDDVFESLIEVSTSKDPLFAHPFYAFLRRLHERYRTNVDLYLFLEQDVGGRRRTLRDVSDHVREEIQAAPWLRLGPHGLDYDHPPYEQPPAAQKEVFEEIFREIDRFAGPGRRSAWLRLHYFTEAFGLSDFWRDNGVTTLLLTDKPALSYHLPADERRRLGERGTVAHGGIELRRTHERMEVLTAQGLGADDIRARLNRHLDRHGVLVVFSHETDMLQEPVRTTAELVLEHVRSLGLTPV